MDFVKKGREVAAELRHAGAAVVIALTHMRLPNDKKLAKEVPGIDLILAGASVFGVTVPRSNETAPDTVPVAMQATTTFMPLSKSTAPQSSRVAMTFVSLLK